MIKTVIINEITYKIKTEVFLFVFRRKESWSDKLNVNRHLYLLNVSVLCLNSVMNPRVLSGRVAETTYFRGLPGSVRRLGPRTVGLWVLVSMFFPFKTPVILIV